MLELSPAATVKPMQPEVKVVPYGGGVRLQHQHSGLGCAMVGFVIALVVALFSGLAGSIIVAAIAGVVAAGAGFWVMKTWMLKRSLGTAELTFDRWPLPLGGTIRVVYQQPLKKQLLVRQFKPTIRCIESATYRVGTDTHTVYHTAFEASLEPTAVDPDATDLQQLWEFALPAEGLPSFHAGNNKVNWALTVDVEIDRHPDAKLEFPLLVTVPKPVEAAA